MNNFSGREKRARCRGRAGHHASIGAHLSLSLDLGLGIQLQLARRALGSPAHVDTSTLRCCVVARFREMRFCHESHHHLGALFSVVCPNYLPMRCQNKYTRHNCLLVFCREFAIDYDIFFFCRSTSKSSSNGSHQTSPAPRRRRPHGGGGRGPVSGPAGGLLHRTQVPRVERGARRGGARLTHARRRSRVTCVPRTCSSSGMIYFLTVGTRPVIRRVRTAPPRPWNPIDTHR